MSAQTIIHSTLNSIKEEAQKDILNNAKKHLLFTDYLLGNDYCSFNQANASIIYDIIDLNNCNLNILINNKIENIEESCVEHEELSLENKTYHKDKKTKSSNTNSSLLYNLWLSKGNSGSLEDFLELVLKNDDVSANWDEIQ